MTMRQAHNLSTLLNSATSIGFVAFAPLSRGLLSGRLTSPDDFAPDDLRRDFLGSRARTSPATWPWWRSCSGWPTSSG
jgi:aryl-alcohol dehydrogenase-like predicted oxidoreductase